MYHANETLTWKTALTAAADAAATTDNWGSHLYIDTTDGRRFDIEFGFTGQARAITIETGVSVDYFEGFKCELPLADVLDAYL